MAEQKFAIRLSAEGMEQVRSALRGMGADGEKALRQLDNAAGKAAPPLRALDAAAKEARAEFDRFADQIPVLGGALKALGPVGTAAAVGVGGLFAAFAAGSQVVRKAIDDIGALKDSADTLQLSVEELQGLRGKALLDGIDSQSLDKMMQTLAINSAKASEGFGKMKAALDKVNPELGRHLALATTQRERVDLLARAITAASSETDKLNIATSAFGADGAQMIRMLDSADASLGNFVDRAKDAGLVLSEKLVNDIEELGDRLAQLEAQRQVALQRGAVAFGGYVEGWERLQTEAVLFLPNLQEQAHDLENQSEEYLQDTIARWREAAAQRVVSEKWAADEIIRIERELAARRAAVPAPEVKLGGVSQAVGSAAGAINARVGDVMAEAQRKAAEAARKAAEALREQQAIEQAAISIRREAGDWTVVLAQKTAELSAVVGQYGVTQEMVNGILAKMRAELDGTAEAQQRFAALMESQKSAIDKIHERMAQFRQDEREGKISTEQMREAIAALNNELTAATAAAKPAADAVKVLGEAHVEARSASFEFGLAVETTDAILRGQMRTFEDWEDVALNALYNVAMGALETQSKIGGSSLGDYFGAVLGAFNIGKAPAVVKHSGGVPEAPGPVRMVPLAAAQGAPRHHTGWDGLGSDEHLAVLQRGEPVVSRFDANRIVRALDGGGRGGGDVNITVINEGGGQVETREMRSADGGRDIELRIRSASAKGAAEGDLDMVMQQRYNIKRGVR